MKNQNGFTLIEISIVLVIIGILAAVAVPKYFDMQEESEKQAAKATVAEAQARINAIFGEALLSGAACSDAAASAENALTSDFGDYTLNVASWDETGKGLPEIKKGNAAVPNTDAYLNLPICEGNNTSFDQGAKYAKMSESEFQEVFIGAKYNSAPILNSDGSFYGFIRKSEDESNQNLSNNSYFAQTLFSENDGKYIGRVVFDETKGKVSFMSYLEGDKVYVWTSDGATCKDGSTLAQGWNVADRSNTPNNIRTLKFSAAPNFSMPAK